MMEINEKVIFEILQTNYGVMVENIVLVKRKSDRQVWKITDTKKGAYALVIVFFCNYFTSHKIPNYEIKICHDSQKVRASTDYHDKIAN